MDADGEDAPKGCLAKRIGVAIVGGSVTLIGLALIVLPGPAIVVIPPPPMQLTATRVAGGDGVRGAGGTGDGLIAAICGDGVEEVV